MNSSPYARKSHQSSASQTIFCPNCGGDAQRNYRSQIVRTECVHCDYVMAFNLSTATVLEAYHPGIML
ncbi:MAG: replication restart DNA helicase PriA [Spirulina sp. SIO3F2]|nr:replication restart DNA helicase PriA [Spirulina sp. SIO3F2]